MAGNALEHPVKSVKTLINNIKSKQKQYSSSIDLSPVKNIDDRAAIEYLINNPEEKERCAAWMSGDENNEDLTRQKKGTMRRSLTVGALGGGLFGAFSGAELGDWVSLLVCSVIGTGVGTLLGYLKGLQNKAAINEQYQRVMHEIESRPSYREKLLDEIKVADGKMSPREFNKKYNK
jgi:ABC-type dipeptide/oligopeptide/nickel transport system permease subunit